VSLLIVFTGFASGTTDVNVAVTNGDFLEFGFTTTMPYELVSMAYVGRQVLFQNFFIFFTFGVVFCSGDLIRANSTLPSTVVWRYSSNNSICRFNHDRSPTGPTDLAFFIDIDGVVATMPFDTLMPVPDDNSGTDVVVNFPSGTMIQSSATIRIVGFGSTNGAGTYALFGTLSVFGVPGMTPCVSKRSFHENRAIYKRRIALLKGRSRDRKRLLKA